tara:strand:+ start:348363 stop:348872 length:510 start_codon:yes stop_codon:yes gene_type:complete
MGLKRAGAELIDHGEPEVVEVDQIDLSEEVIWKARAAEAEEKLAVCEARVADLERELAEANDAVVSTQRRGDIERELTAARAVDLETACLLTEATIGEMDDPDVAVAVRELKSRKPFLFSCATHGTHGSVMSSQAGSGGGGGLGRMASSARSSGDRNELLRYLRARRGG